MNTEKSDAQVVAFKKQAAQTQRKTLVFEREIQHSAASIFPLLCPSRECDWIPGWTADLVYSDSGYAEEDCIFTTEDPAGLGHGVWVLCRYEQDRRVEFVRVLEHLVYQLRIVLTPESDRVTHMSWQITLTGLDTEGQQGLAELPDPEIRFARVMHLLNHYLDTGETANP